MILGGMVRIFWRGVAVSDGCAACAVDGSRVIWVGVCIGAVSLRVGTLGAAAGATVDAVSRVSGVAMVCVWLWTDLVPH